MNFKIILIISFLGLIIFAACEDISVMYQYPELKQCMEGRDDMIKDLIKDKCRFKESKNDRRSVIVRCMNHKAVTMIDCSGGSAGVGEMQTYEMPYCSTLCVTK